MNNYQENYNCMKVKGLCTLYLLLACSACHGNSNTKGLCDCMEAGEDEITSTSSDTINSQNPQVIGISFGSYLDSVKSELVKRYGKDKIETFAGERSPLVPSLTKVGKDMDSLLFIKTPIYIFDNQLKTAKGTLLAFQNAQEEIWSLYQIGFLISDLPEDWEDMLGRIFDSLYDYISPQYPNDVETYINEYGIKCFRFGKAKYNSGVWYGLYNVERTVYGFRILLIYTCM